MTSSTSAVRQKRGVMPNSPAAVSTSSRSDPDSSVTQRNPAAVPRIPTSLSQLTIAIDKVPRSVPPGVPGSSVMQTPSSVMPVLPAGLLAITSVIWKVANATTGFAWLNCVPQGGR